VTIAWDFGPFRKTFTTAYRANGQKQSLTYPDGSIASFNYDSTGRLTTQQTPAATSPPPTTPAAPSTK
jgi:YD repeat-containing protein